MPIAFATATALRTHRVCHVARMTCARSDDTPSNKGGTDGNGGNDEVESSAMTAAASTLILKRAATSYLQGGRRPPPRVVRESILQLEKVQRRNKISSDVTKLLGQWRLVFIADQESSLPWKTLFFPLRAHQTFTGTDESGEFDNGVFLLGKSLFFRVIGPFRWVARGNRLEFSVDRLKLGAGPWEFVQDGLDKDGYSLEGRTSKDLPFFTFFCIRDDIAVARGRSGGLALYARVPDDERL